MEELLVHPQCKSIDDEMQVKLNQEYEQVKSNIVIDGINPKESKIKRILIKRSTSSVQKYPGRFAITVKQILM